MSGFDNRKTLSYRADAPSFSAVITPGTAVQTAVLTWKPTYKKGAPSVTANTMDKLMAELVRLDADCKFYKTGADSNALSAKDAATLEALRTDSQTSDSQYRMMCKSFGVKPQPRNLTATVASKAQPAVGVIAQLAAWPDFQREHGEIFQPPFGDLNLRIIEQYLLDEGNLPSTPANLEQAYRELKAANCFRTVNTLTRDLNGSLIVVQPYSHDRILQMRNQQAAAIAGAPPAHLSDVDREVWQAVRKAYPTLSVNSAGFKKCCSDTCRLWAKDFCIEADPSLAATGKRGELNAAIDRVIFQWARQSNPNAGKNLSQRVWLGTIFF